MVKRMFSHNDPYIDWDKEPDIAAFQYAQESWYTEFLKAEEIMVQLAVSGSVAALVYLAEAHQQGENCKKNDLAAMEWFSKAEESGWKPASHRKGLILANQGRTREAYKEFKKSAELDYLPGVYQLGRALSEGSGVEKNIEGGKIVLERAAQRGHLFAKRKLLGNYFTLQYGFFNFFCCIPVFASLIKHLVLVIAKDIDKPENIEKQI